MDLELFDYELPLELIAQEPSTERDAARLMVINRATGVIEHQVFSDLPDYLRAGDVLVMNDSRVIPARLIGEKRGTGAVIELMLAQPRPAGGELTGYSVESAEWLALARPARRLKVGDSVDFPDDLSALIQKKNDDGSVEITLSSTTPVLEAIEHNGMTPLPPYIKRAAEAADAELYQTVYAAEPGSVAAPTAGLHFTSELIEACIGRGVQVVCVTLHVGIDTFRPVSEQRVEDHQMHSEWYHIDTAAAAAINAAKREGRRVVCVGTTSVRTLEGASRVVGKPAVRPGWGSTDLYIYPGYEYQVADALVTNFHLPKSTLLMLVSAFYDREKMLAAYSEAVERRYRFFSYGDAMLIV